MEPQLTSRDKRRIEKNIRKKYAKLDKGPEGLFRYPTGRIGLEKLSYTSELIQALPDTVAMYYVGVGNPFTLGPIHEGEAVLDIGCGAGIDAILAAMMVGPAGTVAGIEMVPEMLARARENLRIMDLANVSFVEGSAETLPYPDDSFDVVISNGVFNLVIDKAKALKEAFRVLKKHGRLMMADQILVGELPKDTKAIVENWAR